MNKFKKVLLFLGITQKIINDRGFERYRLNPYNPLSYLTLILTLLVMFIKGFVGATIEVLKESPFKYK